MFSILGEVLGFSWTNALNAFNLSLSRMFLPRHCEAPSRPFVQLLLWFKPTFVKRKSWVQTCHCGAFTDPRQTIQERDKACSPGDQDKQHQDHRNSELPFKWCSVVVQNEFANTSTINEPGSELSPTSSNLPSRHQPKRRRKWCLRPHRTHNLQTAWRL